MLRPHHPDRSIVRVAESQVMGRNAVAVVVACIQPTALAQLTNIAQGSENLDKVGVPHLADAWAVVMLLAGVAMLASYLLPHPDDTRVLENAANAFVATVPALHHLLTGVPPRW